MAIGMEGWNGPRMVSGISAWQRFYSDHLRCSDIKIYSQPDFAGKFRIMKMKTWKRGHIQPLNKLFLYWEI